MNILSILLPALLPAVSDGLRGLIARFTGGAGAQPQNVAETIQLMQAQTERVKALAELDALGQGASRWVVDLRGAFRYLAVGGILASTMAGVYAGLDPVPMAVMLELSGACMSFIIGERMYLGIKK